MSTIGVHPTDLVRLRRSITAMSAILLPHRADGAIDWTGFEAHVRRTAEAGLVPAVNMDTGYVQLLDDAARREVLDRTAALLGGTTFVAGAYVADGAGDDFDLDATRKALDLAQTAGALPVIFPSYGLARLEDDEWVGAHADLATTCDRFLGFELSERFSPAGRLRDLATWSGLLDITACVGAKHSSLHREPEWARLRVRDERRPDFLVLTGNDLAIDMVMYGSDYLLGLSTFAPDLFAERDRLWAAGDPGFYELNDGLQALGTLTFRDPVPAYRHDAAAFLRLRGWIGSDATPPGIPRRPAGEDELLVAAGRALGVL
ncbi:MAG: dihydrodipicolinate synthase family protein [Acidimicrobiia bacterium]|nr:dihydrodipicolinate synthase family protein [Acidimicrobiia bacterium]